MPGMHVRAGMAKTWTLLLAVGIVVSLAGCSTNDDEGDTPTAGSNTPTQVAAQQTSTTAATLAPATLSAKNGTLISDGICEALVPEGWVDDGTGQGTTTGGHPFVLFGGRVPSDAEWESSTNLIATPGAGYTVESIDKDDDSVLVMYVADRGFEYRKRFGDRYCDFRVNSRGSAISADEQAYWDAVIESLKPVP